MSKDLVFFARGGDHYQQALQWRLVIAFACKNLQWRLGAWSVFYNNFTKRQIWQSVMNGEGKTQGCSKKCDSAALKQIFLYNSGFLSFIITTINKVVYYENKCLSFCNNFLSNKWEAIVHKQNIDWAPAKRDILTKKWQTSGTPDLLVILQVFPALCYIWLDRGEDC